MPSFAQLRSNMMVPSQEPNKDNDDELVRKINIKINGEAAAAAPAPASVHALDQASLLAMIEVLSHHSILVVNVVVYSLKQESRQSAAAPAGTTTTPAAVSTTASGDTLTCAVFDA